MPVATTLMAIVIYQQQFCKSITDMLVLFMYYTTVYNDFYSQLNGLPEIGRQESVKQYGIIIVKLLTGLSKSQSSNNLKLCCHSTLYIFAFEGCKWGQLPRKTTAVHTDSSQNLLAPERLGHPVATRRRQLPIEVRILDKGVAF